MNKQICSSGYDISIFLGCIFISSIINEEFVYPSPIFCILVPGIISLVLISLLRTSEILRKYYVLSFPSLLIATGMLVSLKNESITTYKGIGRASGLFSNPNVYGILMCCSLLALLSAIFNMISSLKKSNLTQNLPLNKLREKDVSSMVLNAQTSSNFQNTDKWARCLHRSTHARFLTLKIILFGIGGILLFVCFSYSLFKSFSRTAWCGLVLAVLYFLFIYFYISLTKSGREKQQKKVFIGTVASFIISFFIILLVIGSLTYDSEVIPIRRILSIFNPADLSVSNRLDVYYGASGMMLDGFWFGHGFSRYYDILRFLYKPDFAHSFNSINTNDYAVVMLSAGIFCCSSLIVFLFRSIDARDYAISKYSNKGLEITEVLVVRIACDKTILAKMIILVFAISFFFTGVLFEFPIVLIFWGAVVIVNLDEQGNKEYNSKLRVFKKSDKATVD